MNKAIENRRASAQLASSQRISQNSAPLWRNAPTNADYQIHHKNSNPTSLSSSAFLAETMAFHRSLRSYPPPPGFKPIIPKDKPIQIKQTPSHLKFSPSVDSFNLKNDKQTQERCHVTNLDSEQNSNSPFYLDYLDTGECSNAKAFDHRSFMEMFRPPPPSATLLDTSQQQSSLPYSVNEFQDSLKISKKVPGTKLKQSSSFTNSFTRNNKMSTDGKANLAFGRTKGREMDLNAPLKTFTSPARPVSEIFTGNLNFSSTDGNVFSQRAQSSYGGYSNQNDPNSNNFDKKNHRHSIADVIGGPSTSNFQPRIGRRHDPELMPAQIKYTFREYAAPSYRHPNQPGSMTTSQSNFLMTSSSAGVSLQRTFAITSQRGMPKKSISMSRLDHLAQPRRRIVPRPAAPPTPTEPQANTQRTQPLRNSQVSSALLRKKPEVPSRRPQSVAISTGVSPSVAKSSKSEVAPMRTTAPSQKPRPKSQIEPLESLASNQQQHPTGAGDVTAEIHEAKPSEDYKKIMAEKRAAFQRQKQEEERKRQEEEENKKRELELKRQQEEEARAREATIQHENQLIAFQEAELKRVEAEKQAKESLTTDSEPSSSENAFVHNLEDSKQHNEMLENRNEISRDGEMFLVTGEVPKPVDPLVNVAMTQSFDASLLTSDRAKSERIAKEKLEEHQAALLKQEEAERQKRKNRVAELLKGRTRKNADGTESPSGSGPSTPAQKTDNEAATMAAEQSSDAEQLAHKLNGIAVSERNADNAQQNGSTEGVTNGELNGHQQDVIKQFVTENEQSLPPTNGF